MGTLDIIELALFGVMVVLLLIQLYQSGYKKGQIDMLNGKQKIHLVEFEDGNRSYERNPKQEHYSVKIKIIK